MAFVTGKTRAPGLRALVIFCALLSLCVSDTVGPRLLPLPGAASVLAAGVHAAGGADVTPAPSRGGSAVVREAMAPPARKHAGAEHNSLHVAARAAEPLVTPPADARAFIQTTYTPVPVSPAVTTRPPGRAPPPSA